MWSSAMLSASATHFAAVETRIYARYFPHDPSARFFVCVPDGLRRSISRLIRRGARTCGRPQAYANA